MSYPSSTLPVDAAPELSHEALPPLLVRRWPERRSVVLATAAILYVLVFALRMADGSTADALSLLYTVPVALLALELGLRAGLVAAGLAIVLVAAWTVVQDIDLGPVGYGTRAGVLLGVGVLAGTFSDRMRRAQHRQAQLLRSGLDLARLDAHDPGSEAPPLAPVLAARAMCIGDLTGVRVELPGEPPAAAGQLVGRPLVVPVPARVEDGGHIELYCDGRMPGLEVRAALSMLALQGAVATDNRLLRARERERLALEAELHSVRAQVAEQRRSLARVLDGQERQRREVALELHEEAAQALAGVLLGLRALRRGDERDDEPELERLRELVHETVVELRRIATGLRPSVLDQLGLRPALVRLAGERAEQVRLDVAGLRGRHEQEVETAVYRLVEEALGTVEGPVDVVVGDRGPDEVRVAITADAAPGAAALADGTGAMIRARVELLGGHVDVGATGVEAVVPARPAS